MVQIRQNPAEIDLALPPCGMHAAVMRVHARVHVVHVRARGGHFNAFLGKNVIFPKKGEKSLFREKCIFP